MSRGIALFLELALWFDASPAWCAKRTPEQIQRDTENLRRSHQVKDGSHPGPGTLAAIQKARRPEPWSFPPRDDE